MSSAPPAAAARERTAVTDGPAPADAGIDAGHTVSDAASPRRFAVSTTTAGAGAASVDDVIALLPAPTGGVSFLTNGRGLVGWGEHACLRVTGPDAAAQIERWFTAQVAALGAGDGQGPVCVVSLGFSPQDESVAVIPSVLVRRTDDGLLMTRIAPVIDAAGDPVPEPVTAPGEVRYSDNDFSTTDFIAAVGIAVGRIRSGAAAKVVLAHGLTARTQFPVDERFLLARLAERYPSCSVYAVDGLIGASPEMLLRRHGTAVTSRVLAGTAWPEHAGSPDAGRDNSGSLLGVGNKAVPTGDAAAGASGSGPSGAGDGIRELGHDSAPTAAGRQGAGTYPTGTGSRLFDAGDAHAGSSPRVDQSVPAEMHRVAADLLTSAKDLAEHEFAVRSVIDVLTPRTQALTVPDAPSVIELANLTHLATDVVGTLADSPGAEVPSALALAAALHPTAAVGGTPTEVAQAMIAELERTPRGRYAAPVGWIDANGDGEFAIALRCAKVDGHTVTMVAGCGIVADSDPMNEAREAQIKMLPIRDALES